MQWNQIALAGLMATIASAANAQSDMSGASHFPGDIGRPFNGLSLPEGDNHPPPRPAPSPSPSMREALSLAKAAVAACKGFNVGVSIIDADGAPKLYYIPDGTAGYHAYMAFRKAYTALQFKVPTSEISARIKTDPALSAKIAGETNFLSFAGGLPILVNGKIVGAIGVSGAEPSAADEHCARVAMNSQHRR